MSDLNRALEALKIANNRIDELENYNLALANESHNKSDRIGRLERENQELAAHVERMRDALHKVLDDSEIGVVPKSHLNSIEHLLKSAPQQSLAEHDAEVARKAFVAGLNSADTGDMAKEYAERVKRGEL